MPEMGAFKKNYCRPNVIASVHKETGGIRFEGIIQFIGEQKVVVVD
jgi:hypothetical protein